MFQSVQAFMSGLIDYAGLFPPAQLSMEEAVARYLRYRNEPDNWVLGRFVVRVDQLSALNRALAGHRLSKEAMTLSVVGTPVNNLGRLFEQAGANADTIKEQRDQAPADWVVRGVEVFLAPEVAQAMTPDLLQSFMEIWAEIGRNGSPPEVVFLETRPEQMAPEELKQFIQTLRHIGPGNGSEERPVPGFKVRCGGEGPEAVPPVELVARIILACRDHQVPFKATAGLHHPFRHYNAREKRMLHGFVNIFGTGVLAVRHRLDLKTAQEIVQDDDFVHFMFTPTGFGWKDLQASVADIRKARNQLYRSLGSCSFEEPLDDLRSLGLLD